MPDKFPQFPSEISSAAATFPSLGEAEMLWRAKYLAESAYLHHLSFLFWLIVDMQPQRVLALDLQDATGYFAVCQAVQRQNTRTTCRGLRFTTGAESENTLKAHRAIEKYNADNYRAFSDIDAVSEDQAAARVADDSVDLLMFERFPSSGLAETFEEVWLPRLSSGGIVLVPGIRGARDDRHGMAWLEDLRDRFPGMSFSHGDGLEVLIVGANPPQRLTHLAQLAQKSSNRRHINEFFDRISQLHVLEVARDAAQEAARGDRNWALRLKTEQQEIMKAYDIRHATTASLQGKLFDRTTELATLQNRQQVDRLVADNTLADQADRIAALEAALEQQLQQNAALQARLEDTRADHAETLRYHRDEVAALVAMNDTQARALKRLRGQLARDEGVTEGALQTRFAEIAALTLALEAHLGEA